MRRLVIATTLLICLAFAGQAHAASAPRSFYGVMAANDPDSTEIARMGTGRVGTLRINFVWGAVQPTAGRAARLEPLRHHHRRRGPAGHSRPPDRLQHADLGGRAGQLPARQEPISATSATFVSQAAAALRQQRDLLVGEPGDPEASRDRLAALERDELAELLVPQAERQAVRRASCGSSARRSRARDPSAKVVLWAACSGRPGSATASALDRYLPAIYRAKAKPLFDAVAMHPYVDDPEGRPARRPGDAPDHGPVQGQEGEALDHGGGLGHGR